MTSGLRVRDESRTNERKRSRFRTATTVGRVGGKNAREILNATRCEKRGPGKSRDRERKPFRLPFCCQNERNKQKPRYGRLAGRVNEKKTTRKHVRVAITRTRGQLINSTACTGLHETTSGPLVFTRSVRAASCEARRARNPCRQCRVH